MADRCPRCDQIKGDDDRAMDHPAVAEWNAAREAGRPRQRRWSDVVAAVVADQPGVCLFASCNAVDWRARCLAAEKRDAESRRLLTVAAAVLGVAGGAAGFLYDINGRAPKVSAADAPGLNYLGVSALYLPDAAEQLADMIRKHLETKP